MEFFTLAQPRMHKGKFVREYGACSPDRVLMRHCYVKLTGEFEELRRQLAEAGAPQDALRVYPDTVLAGVPYFPWRVGRLSLLPGQEQGEQGEQDRQGDRVPVLHAHSRNPLLQQLRALHAAKGKRHYRIAIVNGFGGKLGDTLVGTTAFRHVRRVIGDILPGFSCDMLTGFIISNDNVRECCKFGEMANMVFLGPSLRDFCAYDAYLDFSSLLMLPRFHQMPMVDWYIWWMGLEPEECPQEEKRNHLCMEDTVLKPMRQRLSAFPERRKVFFNPLASVPLRSFPEELRADFVLRLLERDRGLRLVVNTPLDLRHERLTVLEESLTLEQYQALIACVDGVIGMNTYSTHVADATATPCVQLCAVLPPTFLPYYPLLASINVPGYENLPGYLLAKVEDGAWEDMRQAYVEAWARLDAEDVLKALEKCIKTRRTKRVKANMFASAGTNGLCYLHDMADMSQGAVLPHLVPHEAWTAASREQVLLLDKYLKIGSGAVVAGLWNYAMVSLFTGKIFHNSLTVYETRDSIIRNLMYYCQRYALNHVRVLTALPAAKLGVRSVPQLDHEAEATAPYAGNVRREHMVLEVPLDSLDTRLDVLVVQPPHDLAHVLAGARASLAKYGTCILCGPVTAAQLEGVEHCLADCGYAAFGKVLDSRGQFSLVVGLPAPEAHDAPQGYAPLSTRPA